MIDGLRLPDLKSFDVTHLNWKSKINRKTGEIEKKQSAQHRGLFLTKYPNGRLTLGGSLTSYLNGDNKKNINYFQICYAIDTLCEDLNIIASETILSELEIGVNVELSYPPDIFLDDLIAWGKCEPIRFKNKKENYVEFFKSQLTLKIYSKSKQFGLHNNLLRFELKIRDLRFIRKLGVRYLSDLKDLEKLKELAKKLVEAFDDLVFYDSSINLNDTKLTERKLLEKGNNPRYWSQTNLHRNTILKNRKRFKELIEKYGKNHFNLIRDKVEETCRELLKNSVQNHPLNNVNVCFSTWSDTGSVIPQKENDVTISPDMNNFSFDTVYGPKANFVLLSWARENVLELFRKCRCIRKIKFLYRFVSRKAKYNQ